MADIVNWYSKLPTKATKKSKYYKNHLIEPNSRILCLGPSGSGKSNALIDFIAKNPVFEEIILFLGSGTPDEPLYKLLKEKIPEVQIIQKIEDLPDLTSFTDDGQKLLVLDDFITLPKKQMKKIEDFFVGSRKRGFTVWAMSQNYTSLPKIISRNCNYIFCFHMNDGFTIKHILKNHNAHDIPEDKFIQMYRDATAEPLSFFTIDLKNKSSGIRKGWTQLYDFSSM
jgi:hypothetical protein